jgi:hypothetical protein
MASRPSDAKWLNFEPATDHRSSGRNKNCLKFGGLQDEHDKRYFSRLPFENFVFCKKC